MVFAIKMLLDSTYGLLKLLEFKYNHFKSLFQAKYEFKDSNFWRENMQIFLRMATHMEFTCFVDSRWPDVDSHLKQIELASSEKPSKFGIIGPKDPTKEKSKKILEYTAVLLLNDGSDSDDI